MLSFLFVKSADNKSDIFTKNVTGENFEQHVDNFVMDRKVIEMSSKDIELGNFALGRVLGKCEMPATRALHNKKISLPS